MIQLPTKTEIEVLEALHKPLSLSLYAPYIAPSSPNNPNRIQLKNLLKEARLQLASAGVGVRDIASTLEPVEKLIDGEEFRANHGHSLALFVQQGFFQFFRLPPDGVSSLIVMGEEFHVQPIIELIDNNPPYYVLILSHNGTQLLKGDYYHIEQLELQKYPTTMKQELRIDEYPNETQTHSVAAADRGKGSEKFHGQYNETQVDKEMLVEFFRRIDHKLLKLLKDEKTPLVIAGVDYLLPLYRQVSTYPNLLADEIRGNLEHSSLDFIRDQATNIIERHVHSLH